MSSANHQSTRQLPVSNGDAWALLCALFPEGCDGFVETRCIRGGAIQRRDFVPTAQMYLTDGVRSPAASWDVYVGVAPRTREEGTKDAIEEIWAAFVDIDNAGGAGRLATFELPPSLVVASGSQGHLHAYWPLEEPATPVQIETINRALAERLGGDTATDASRVMRMPGTYNCKHDPPVKARLLVSEERRFTLDELWAVLGDERGDPASGTVEIDEIEASAPVARVLERLDGVTPGSRGWMALCPAHDDHRPSLSVTEGDDGRCLVHCFAGCAPEKVVEALGLDLRDLFSDNEAHGRASVAAELVAIAEHRGAELFHDPKHQAFAWIPVGEHRECRAIESIAFRRWLRRHFYKERGRVANSQALADAIDLLSAMAEFEGQEHEVHVRVAPYGDGVLVDLADDDWRVVHIRPGKVEVLSQSPVPFIRGPATRALPEPVLRGSLDELRPFLNLPGEWAWRLVMAEMIASLIGRGPFPVLIFQGEKGSGKSTAPRVIRHVIDPAKPALRGGTPDDRELMIAARTNWVVAFDNLSRLSTRLSDSLCRLSTGAGFGTRRLYTDEEEVVFDAMRPITLNGIADIATRPDLLSRSIVIELPVLGGEDILPESEFYERLEEARPRILGALLELAAKVLALLPNVELERAPRMADFARIGVAVEEALGWPEGSFLAAYRNQESSALEGALDADPVAAVLLTFMEQDAQREGWRGTATQLLSKLTRIADDDVTRRRNWPATASVLGKRLKELAPALRPTGLEIEKGSSGRASTKQRGLWIYWASRDGDGGDAGDG